MATQVTPSAVVDATAWKFQQTYIERLMDHSALSSAHPDDTLILAGPPRWVSGNIESIYDKLLPIGMIQSMQVSQQKPTTPMQAVGSGRGFYISGKAQGQTNIQRLFVNGRNLLRALYTNALQAGIDATKFDEPAAWGDDPTAKFYANLDSELFLIPLGLAVFFRDKLHDEIGAFYLELCTINSWAIGVSAGQNMVMENVSMFFDRLMPISTQGAGQSKTPNYHPQDPASSAVFKAVFQSENVTVNPQQQKDVVQDHDV
jgi:hypothetical protein